MKLTKALFIGIVTMSFATLNGSAIAKDDIKASSINKAETVIKLNNATLKNNDGIGSKPATCPHYPHC